MIELRPTRPDDLDALSELFVEGFGHPLSAAEWEWKYLHSPGAARSAVAVVAGGAERGRILAHAGALGLPARYRAAAGEGEAREGLLWQLVDWVGTRHTGLIPPLVRLGRWLLAPLPGPEDAPWNFGFPSRRHLDLGKRVFGYGEIRTFRERVGALAAAAGPLPAALDIEASDRWTGDAAGLEALWTACCPFGIRRDETFLRWRYWARPGRYYRIYRIRKADAEGLAVFAFVGTEARAAELWLPPGGPVGETKRGPGGLAAALPALAEDLLASGLTHWRFWPPPPATSDALAGLSLEPAEEVLLGYRPRGGGQRGHRGTDAALPAEASAELPREAESFYHAMGDYDLT